MDSTSLVPGDVVMIREGERVPADIRIIDATEPCNFNTSAIDGRSSEWKRVSTKSTSMDYMIAQNMAFCGYLCVSGHCKGIVVSTSERTVIGNMIKQNRWPPKTTSS